jgi:hypothetical protein
VLVSSERWEWDASLGPVENANGSGDSFAAVTVYREKLARYMQFLPLYGSRAKY